MYCGNPAFAPRKGKWLHCLHISGWVDREVEPYDWVLMESKTKIHNCQNKDTRKVVFSIAS